MKTTQKLILALALVVGGCDILGPDVGFVDRRPMHPVPAEYAAWYAEVESCVGERGDFHAVEWHEAAEIHFQGRPSGLLEFPHRVTMLWAAVKIESVVKHEMVHHVLRRGDSLHGGSDMERCA